MEDFVDIHTHHIINANKFTIVNVELYSNVKLPIKYSVGIHPWFIETLDIDKALVWVEEQIHRPNTMAIGEIGLDRAISYGFELQKELFIYQHKLAERANKPIIIHCVKAYSDFLALHKQLNPSIPWIFHGFTGNGIMANEFIKRRCYLSFGKGLLSSTKMQNSFKDLPLQSVFFETDDSDVKIDSIYEKAAKLRHICINDLRDRVHKSFIQIFGK